MAGKDLVIMAIDQLAEFVSYHAAEIVALMGFPLIVMAFVVIMGGLLAYVALKESIIAALVVQMVIFAIFIAVLLPLLM